MPQQPNILFIMTDQMRGDCMGVAGHPDVKTPYLDSLAANGVRYPQAYSACPTCVPARAVLHTGLSQRHTGRIGYEDRVDWNYQTTMAGELAKAGYHTQCVGKMHVHPLRSLLGFHNVELHDGYLHEYRFPPVDYHENQLVADDYFHWLKNELGADADITNDGLDCNGWVARPWPWAEKYHPTNWVADRSIDFLRRRDPRKPFFLMASFVRPHAPFDPPAYYFDMYKNKTLRPPLQGDWDDTELLAERGGVYNAPCGPRDPELIREMMAGYYGCITHLDHQIGRLLMALTEHRLADNTIILFTSDHGEMLGDHALIQKGRPYQGSIHIPMMLSGPEALLGAGRHGVVDESLVELRDVMPTLLDLAGAPCPEGLDGRSFAHGLKPGRDWLHGEHIVAMKNRSHQFIVTKQDKYIWFSHDGTEQYFDLQADPGETHNAIEDAQYAARIAELRALLVKELAGCEEGYSDGTRLIPGKTPRPCLAHARETHWPPDA